MKKLMNIPWRAVIGSLLCTISLTNCKKDKVAVIDEPVKHTDVYASGYEFAASGKDVAEYYRARLNVPGNNDPGLL